MSLPDRFLSAIKAFCIGFFALGAAVLIAGCSVQPLYSSNHGAGSAIGGSVTPDMRTKLASIAIDPAGDIFGQEVRNELIFLFSGGAGEPANPAYRLSLGLSTNTIAAVSVDIGDQTDRTGRPRPVSSRRRRISCCVTRTASRLPRVHAWLLLPLIVRVRNLRTCVPSVMRASVRRKNWRSRSILLWR